jgi:hypothetical protein
MCGNLIEPRPADAAPAQQGEVPAIKSEFAGPDRAQEEKISRKEEWYAQEARAAAAPVVRKVEAPAVADSERKFDGVDHQRDAGATNTTVATDTAVATKETTKDAVARDRGSVRPEPVFTAGASMLGLAGAAPVSPVASVDGDGTYLLDESPRRTVSWRAWAMVLLLCGFGYLGWKEWYAMRHPVRPDVAKVLASQGQAASDEPVKPESHQSADSSKAPKPEQTASAQSNQSPPADAGDNKQQAAPPPPEAAQGAKTEHASATASTEPTDSAAKTKKKPALDEKPTEKPASTLPKNAEPPTPEAVDYSKDPMLVRAQKYIHGHPQNCAMGLNYLKSAAESNPKARIQMAALYQSGTCVAMDRAEAYHWFSLAQDMEPHNMWLEKSRSQLWANMSPQERARAK